MITASIYKALTICADTPGLFAYVILLNSCHRLNYWSQFFLSFALLHTPFHVTLQRSLGWGVFSHTCCFRPTCAVSANQQIFVREKVVVMQSH